MNFEQILRALLSGVYKMTDGDIDAILTASEATEDSVKAALLEKDQSRVTTLLKGKEGSQFKDGYKKGKAEERTALEKEIKEHFSIDSDATGVDLMAEIVEAQAKPGTTTEEEIKKSPAYIQRERELLNKIKEQKTDFDTKWSERETQDKREKTFGAVSKTALELLDELKPVYPESPSVANTWKTKFIEEFKGYDYELPEGADPKTANVLKDGRPVTDAHGHYLTFADLVKTTAPNFFTFSANNGGQNGGNGAGGNQSANGKPATGYPAGITRPKTFDEYSKIVNDRTIKLEDRAAVTDAWEAEQQQGTA